MGQPLKVPMKSAAMVHLQQGAQAALAQISQTLRRAMIRATAKVTFSLRGTGRIVVYVQGPFAVEASLLLPKMIDRFTVVVV